MNGKKAKLLRKVVGFSPSEKREYTTVNRGKGRKLLITEDGFKEEIVDKVQVIANESRRRYKIAKRIYKQDMKKGGQ